ncbi:MAG: hypothetical protein ACKVY0_05935 [Prosthecobacter sp.]|uniref:hypothetical protein n=1 Tax=Prosthecobacter sp. TaxID=1965333 RepID=UPI0038FE89B5
MKKLIHKSVGALLITATLITASITLAQSIEATSTTTTSEGTVSEFGPQGIVIKTAAGTQPVRYISSETTNYVDENGSPITAAAVASGLPVTVYYTKVGDTLIASKIMVKRAPVAPLTVVAIPATVISAPVTTLATTQTTTSAGIISEFGPEQIIIRTESSPDPLRYTYSKTTTYVDETGTPVARDTVKSGLPVTVYYTRVGSTLVANKVIVRTAVVTAVPVIETKTTTTTTRNN